jgi:hypothetical protein
VLRGDARELDRVGIVGDRGDRANERLEPPPGDDEPARAARADADRVGDVRRREEELAGGQRADVVADPQRQLALDDVEALALVAMDVQRRLAAGRATDSMSAKSPVSALDAWMRARLSKNWISSVIYVLRGIG